MSENLVIRAANERDIDQLLELSILVGTGMTSMPSDRKNWERKLERSIANFNSAKPNKCNDLYFMVLEDTNKKSIVGSGAVYAGIGLDHPFYSYKLSTITTNSEQLDLTVHTPLLSLVNDFGGTSEIGSLFLVPEYRRDGIGKFLSRSRFLILADFPDRFDDTVFAEMRGWQDAKGRSPFWDSLGNKFFGLTFQKADFISAVDGVQFISDLMPRHPVYVDLLSKEAQDVIGRPHDDGVGAYNILLKEGFRYSRYVDIFDAGPTISCPIDQIKTAKQSRKIVIKSIVQDTDIKTNDSYIISNSRLPDYRMTRGAAQIDSNGEVTVSKRTANALNLEQGQYIRVVLERPNTSAK